MVFRKLVAPNTRQASPATLFAKEGLDIKRLPEGSLSVSDILDILEVDLCIAVFAPHKIFDFARAPEN